MDVLVAVRVTVTNPQITIAPVDEGGPGRAVIVLEDAGEKEINVHVSFHPELSSFVFVGYPLHYRRACRRQESGSAVRSA
ncbi:hypothetical protein NBH00_18125 [Paraconexibacter antarcticus]|uniref:Uncharacterized protein n=1 Tax=Paraconexibacter antarcticus TaxID=2949664 RepID=A0ABY5DRR3_9ACTN|nr:hypothetical protein [Paraconexibacter antarcticus]UTI63264.1 hypothetical protein NBH00_18125 [Paraconexibacter antarcticus]